MNDAAQNFREWLESGESATFPADLAEQILSALNRPAEPSAPFDCKNHVPSECPTCIATWAQLAPISGETL